MALTQISTGGIKDDAVTDAKLPANSVGNSEMKDDAVGVAELSATGTASSSTFLRGDNSWVTPTDTNTQLSTEEVQDIVGGMFTGNTETNIAATYQDSDGTIDLVSTDTNTQLAFANDANNRVVTGDGSGGLNGEANLTFDGSTLKVNSTSVGIVDVYRSDGGNADEARISIGAYSSNPPSQRGVQVVAYNNNAGHDMHFRTSSSHSAGPTTKAEIGSNGNLKISDGDLVIGTSGHGIDFAATAGTGDSELLDDYEKGSFTLTPNLNNVSITDNTFYYVKIGDLVTYSGRLNYSGASGVSDQILGLPFTSRGGNATQRAMSSSILVNSGLSIGNEDYFIVYSGEGQTRLHMNSHPSGTYNMPGAADIHITGFYYTDA